MKSHLENIYNERVDVRAKWGAGIPVDGFLDVCLISRVLPTCTPIAAAAALFRNNSDTYGRPTGSLSFGLQTIDCELVCPMLKP